MKSRITEKTADNKTQQKKEADILKKGENITIEDLLELGIIDENAEINIYPKGARNVINHDKV